MERELWNPAFSPIYDHMRSRGRWPAHSNSRLSPGSDVAAEMAAAFAISSLVFGKT